MKRDGGPAFPRPGNTVDRPDGSQMAWIPEEGMSLLDYFAAAALSAYQWERTQLKFRPTLARYCYDIAEALLAERERRRIGAAQQGKADGRGRRGKRPRD